MANYVADDLRKQLEEAKQTIAFLERVLPAEATSDMIKAVESIVSPYAAKLIWKRMLEAAPRI